MRNKGWNKTEVLKREKLDKYSWFQGFFTKDFGNHELYKRDFEEMRLRDISLFTLGNIEGKKILDIGCGSGLYTLTFLKLGAKYVAGQDISQEAVDIAINFCEKDGFTNFDIVTGDCENLLFEADSFDIAFSGDVFEHITDNQKKRFISEIYRVLKPGGLLTIKTPNRKYLKMSILFKRLIALIKMQDPFKIHIAHTKNNPDNEHHGLTTHKRLAQIFEETMFHSPVITWQELNRKIIPRWIAKKFKKSKYFNQHIIMTVRKPIFYGIYKCVI